MKLILIFLTACSLAHANLPPTSSKGNGESTYSTTYRTNYDTIPVTRSGTTVTVGTIPVAKGGTGATSLTANNVVLGNGTSAVQVVAPGSAGNILTSNGTTWASDEPEIGVPGSTGKVDLLSFSFGGTTAGNNCTTGTCFLDQTGTGVTSVVWNSTGNYTMTFPVTYAELRCTASATALGTSASITGTLTCLSCSTLAFSTIAVSTAAGANSAGTINCFGFR